MRTIGQKTRLDILRKQKNCHDNKSDKECYIAIGCLGQHFGGVEYRPGEKKFTGHHIEKLQRIKRGTVIWKV